MLLPWIYLACAIALEVSATLALKSAGQGNPAAVATVVVGYVASFGFLALVLQKMEISIAYAVWAGVGTAAIAIVGMAALGEPANAAKLGSIALIIAGVVGLNLAGAH